MCGHNERLWQTLDIGNMLRPTFGFKYSHEFQFKELNYGSFFGSPPNFYLPTRENLHCLILPPISR